MTDCVASHLGLVPKRTFSPPHPTLNKDSFTREPVAIVGLAAALPGAETVPKLWDQLLSGEDLFTPLPRDRGWDLSGLTSLRGAFLSHIDRFDPLFFHIPPKQAQLLDPAERLFLQESWRAIEDAGIDPQSLAGKRWGVFCGGSGDYTQLIMEQSGVSPHVTTSSIPARVSYTLGLSGPSVSLDVGCASSLLAVTQACDQLHLGHCEGAIAGGVLLYTTPNLIRASLASELLSSHRYPGVLDANADGMLPAEGVVALVLKRLSDAQRDADRIYGVIEGWGSNHSGKTNGMSAPSARAQSDLCNSILSRFKIDPASIDLVEVNATGTPLGDRMEIEALAEVLAPSATWRTAPCLLGSIENHLGHSFQCSGATHLLKVALALHHGQIPATRHIHEAHPALAVTPFELTHDQHPWPVCTRPRRALVNSFGATGTNVALILSDVGMGDEVSLTPRPEVVPAQAVVIALSAHTPAALRERARRLREFLEQNDIAPSRLAANLLRRAHFNVRCAFVAGQRAQILAMLKSVAQGREQEGIYHATLTQDCSNVPPVATGQSAEVAAQAYVQGACLDGFQRFETALRRPLSLPCYPFEARRCWLDKRSQAQHKEDYEGDEPAVALSWHTTLQTFLCEVTGYSGEEIDPSAPLSRYGLDSLMTMRYLALLNEHFGLNLQLADLLEHESIEALAARMWVLSKARGEEKAQTLLDPEKSPEPSSSTPSAASDEWLLERLSL
jgi:polyketide synthase PksL